MEYLLIIPGRLDNLNDYIGAERANKYKGAKMKADNEAIVKAAIIRQLRIPTITKRVRMEYLWVEKNQRRDLDNISSFGRKVIQDELVKSRILQNDGWANIVGFSDSFAVDKQDPRIEVKIIEVDE